LAELKKILKKLLKKYDAVKDIIIFGSFVKGGPSPKDIDLALIVEQKNTNLVNLIKREIDISKTHLEFVIINDIYSSPLFLSLINEGFSIKKGDFLRNILKTKPMRLYIYDLTHLDKSHKTLFGIALKKNLKKIGGEKISVGAVLVPMQQTSYFEDFLDVWGMKYKTKEFTVI